MILDIFKREINVGDECIFCDRGNTFKIKIVKETVATLHYVVHNHMIPNTFNNVVYYMHKHNKPAKNMYKI